MAGFKETPRQKMIGMMYLVLTALLALNVSKEILDAFVIVNESVVDTRENFSGKVGTLHEAFEKQNSLDPVKVGPFFSRANVVKEKSEELISYMDSLKTFIISKTEGITMEEADTISLKDVRGKDQYETPSQKLLGTGDMLKNGRGYELMERIQQYRVEMYNLLDEEDRDNFQMGLVTDPEGGYRNADGQVQDWVEHNFYHTILAADITIFNKLVNDVKNVEYDMVNYLYKDITEEDFKVGKITAKVLPTSVYVFQGDPYEAHIFVAAVDESSKPTVDYVENITEFSDNLVGSAVHVPGDSGVVKLSIPTKGKEPREYTFAGQIGVMKPDGNIMYKPFNSSYFVLAPSANVAATKMNVFYRGVDNPVRISAAGIPESKLGYRIVGDGSIADVQDGLVVRGLNKRNVNSVIVKVFSKGENGEADMALGEQEFRVKKLPPPDILVPGMDMEKLSIAKQALLVNAFLQCKLPDYVNFDYTYKVLSFDMEYVKDGDTRKKNSTSNRLTTEMKEIIKRMRNGSLVFRNIKVKGPTGPEPVKPFVLQLK